MEILQLLRGDIFGAGFSGVIVDLLGDFVIDVQIHHLELCQTREHSRSIAAVHGIGVGTLLFDHAGGSLRLHHSLVQQQHGPGEKIIHR